MHNNVFELFHITKNPQQKEDAQWSILHSREATAWWTREPQKLIRRPPEAWLKNTRPTYTMNLISNPALEPLLWTSSPNPLRLGHTVFEGMSSLCPPLPGRAIKLFFLLQPKLYLQDSSSALVHRGRVLATVFLVLTTLPGTQTAFKFICWINIYWIDLAWKIGGDWISVRTRLFLWGYKNGFGA